MVERNYRYVDKLSNCDAIYVGVVIGICEYIGQTDTRKDRLRQADSITYAAYNRLFR